MLGLAIILAGGVFGAGVLRRLGWRLGRVEQLALAAAFALTATPWVLFLAAWALGFTFGLPAGVAVLGVAGWRLGRGRRLERADGPGPSRLSWFALALLFALLFHGHMLHTESTGLWTGGNTYGDLALHATFATHFSTAEIGFASPIAAGESLTYPFLGDFLVACLVRGGWSMPLAFAVTGWLSAMTGLALVDALARRMFGSRAAGTIAVWLIVASGALVGLWHAAHDVAARGLPRAAADLPSYANMWERGVTWSNIVCDFILPQRAFLAAFPAMWAIAFLVRGALDEADARPDRVRRLVAAGALAGSLPFVHVHSFLLAAAILGLAALWRSLRRGAERAPWWFAVAGALVLAAPQLAWQLGESLDASFGRWHLGWRAPRGEFWRYWLSNWGLPLLLAPAAAAIAVRAIRRGEGSFAALLVIGAIATFTAGNLYLFQPHDWDNMKFFIYAHMSVAVVLAGGLARWIAARGVRRLLAAAAIAGMTGTGALALVRELDKHDQLASTSDVAVARRLRALLPTDARVLTSDQHNHIVPMLTGRSVVMGYRGWLWTHGIDYRVLERDVREMFDGGHDAERLMRRRGVTHVYIGPGELAHWGADAGWFRARYPVVLREAGIEVFDVRRTTAQHLTARAP